MTFLSFFYGYFTTLCKVGYLVTFANLNLFEGDVLTAKMIVETACAVMICIKIQTVSSVWFCIPGAPILAVKQGQTRLQAVSIELLIPWKTQASR